MTEPLLDLGEALGFREDASSLGVAVRLLEGGDLPGSALMLRALERDAEIVRTLIVQTMLESKSTWAQIGEVLGVTPQAANKRYGEMSTRRRADAGRSRS
jgi:hypothetical protein